MLAPLYFLLIGASLAKTLGTYNWRHIPVFAAATGLFALLWATPGPARSDADGRKRFARLLAGCAVAYAGGALLLVARFRAPKGTDALALLTIKSALGTHLAIALALVGAAVWVVRRSRHVQPLYALVEERWFRVGVAANLVILVAVRVMTLALLPTPFIDVFTSNTQAADYFLAGLNPYSGRYVDIYDGFYDYPPGFVYWPGLLYGVSFARLVFGDIRMLFVLSDLAIVTLIFRSSRRLYGKSSALFGPLFALLWLSFPVSLHVLHMAWVDTSMLPGGLLIAYAFLTSGDRPRWRLVGVAAGAICSVKLYGALLALVTAVAVFRLFPARAAWKAVGAAAATAGALILPLALWDFESFWRMTVAVPMTQAGRLDSFSITAMFQRSSSAPVPQSWFNAVIGICLAASAMMLWKRLRPALHAPDAVSHWSAAVVVSHASAFLLWKQSFCNYYFFLAFFVLVLLIVQPRRCVREPAPAAAQDLQIG